MMSRNYIFFFFKQTTAYEIRISDWSSDVCSSDLELWRLLQRLAGQLRLQQQFALGLLLRQAGPRQADRLGADAEEAADIDHHADDLVVRPQHQIGYRADVFQPRVGAGHDLRADVVLRELVIALLLIEDGGAGRSVRSHGIGDQKSTRLNSSH